MALTVYRYHGKILKNHGKYVKVSPVVINLAVFFEIYDNLKSQNFFTKGQSTYNLQQVVGLTNIIDL